MDIDPYSFALEGVRQPLRRALRRLKPPEGTYRLSREAVERAAADLREALDAIPYLRDWRNPEAPRQAGPERPE